MPALAWTAILMFACRLGARRQIHHRLNLPTVAAYLGRLACQALQRVPHGDTVAGLVGVAIGGLIWWVLLIVGVLVVRAYWRRQRSAAQA